MVKNMQHIGLTHRLIREDKSGKIGHEASLLKCCLKTPYQLEMDLLTKKMGRASAISPKAMGNYGYNSIYNSCDHLLQVQLSSHGSSPYPNGQWLSMLLNLNNVQAVPVLDLSRHLMHPHFRYNLGRKVS